MSDVYVGAVDQGTTSTRFMVFDRQGEPVAYHQVEHKQIYPQPGWVEHDPIEIINNTILCIDETVQKCEAKGIQRSQIKTIGITNQRETTVVWDKYTGKPLFNAIVWLDTRTRETCERLGKDRDRFRSLCGLPVSTYFSGVKLRWIIDNVPEVKQALEEGRAIFGTIDTWLVWNLTGKKVHVTDITNAGRTLLMNIEKLDWEPKLLDALGIPKQCLPEIRSSAERYGTLECSLLRGVPISGILGDQQAALVGQTCFRKGDAKNTYGTGCFLIVNTGEGAGPVPSHHGLLTTPGYQLGPDKPVAYALEGSIPIAGAAVQWLRDNLQIIKDAPEVEVLANSVKDCGDVFFVPAFSGLFAPHWREDARGVIVGLTQYTTKAHIARAVLEAVSFQVCDIIGSVEADSKATIKVLKVDGGMTANNTFLQLQSDLLQCPIVRPHVTETTVVGAAFAAGLAENVWSSQEELVKLWKADKEFSPKITIDESSRRWKRWKQALEKSYGWV
eukprot:jgi/Galph1/6064/GphlegSOOS_G4725.1